MEWWSVEWKVGVWSVECGVWCGVWSVECGGRSEVGVGWG